MSATAPRLRIVHIFVVATLFQIGNNSQSYDNGVAFFDQKVPTAETSPSSRFFMPTTAISSATPPRQRRYGNSTLEIKDHPHAGALDEFGHHGYVHDPTILKYMTTQFHVSKDEKRDLCAPAGDGPEGYEDLGRKFFNEHIQVTSPLSPPANEIKVFCAVYTHAANNNQMTAIRETWGKRCDGFMAASTETNHSTATVNIPHRGPYQGQYKGLWQRVRSIVSYFHDHFLQDFDYLYLSGDDTFVIMENLKEFLASKRVMEHSTPYFYTGARTHPIWMKNQEDYDTHFFYMGGGAGYILSRRTVQAIVKEVLPKCHEETVGSAEDVYMGRCLQNVLNVTGFDSRDDDERDRFIQYDPLRRSALPNPVDRGFMGYVRRQNVWLQENHNWTAKYGIDAIAPSAISFHMVQPPVKMRRFERLLYRSTDETYETLDCGNHVDRQIPRKTYQNS